MTRVLFVGPASDCDGLAEGAPCRVGNYWLTADGVYAERSLPPGAKATKMLRGGCVNALTVHEQGVVARAGFGQHLVPVNEHGQP